MKRLLLVAVLAVLALTLASPASAATHSPCTSHIAVAPYVSDVTDGVTTIGGAGQIGGCPVPVGTEGVAITVCLQARVEGGWVDQTCQTVARSWSRISRFPRRAGTSVFSGCVLGDMRTDVRGALADGTADGFAVEWASPAVTMVRNDSGVCGVRTGGGD